ncbi:hypothetical protein L1887_43399 [Cichorium endivia]|nr:hypothetical protein L1887_43399 [Cichorium endivia]
MPVVLQPSRSPRKTQGVAGNAHEDERVGKRLELGRDGGFERLSLLRVVILDKRDCIDGSLLNDGGVEDLAQVVRLGRVARLLHVVMQRRVKERELLVAKVAQVLEARVEVVLPELANTKGDRYPRSRRQPRGRAPCAACAPLRGCA